MNTSYQYPLGLIGCGHMGMAIIRGAVRKHCLEASQICVFDRKKEVRQACRKEGFVPFDSLSEAAGNCHIVLLAVTPQAVDEVLTQLAGKTECLLSIVTGISIGYIHKTLSENVPVVRVMPNTPLQLGCGASAICRSENCPPDKYSFILRLFEAVGVVREIPEEQMNEVITVSGSTPAYFYYFLQCLLDDAVSRGMDEKTARELLVQTMIGSGRLLEQKADRPVSELVDEVCSKGGTTIEAVSVLKKEGLGKILSKASDACLARAKELSR